MPVTTRRAARAATYTAGQRHPKHRRWASLADTAEYLGLSEKTLRRRIADGTITGYRIGRTTIRCDLNEIDAAARPIPSARIGGGDVA